MKRRNNFLLKFVSHFPSNFFEISLKLTQNKIRVATMTYFCTFDTVTPVLIIGFGWFFSRSQAALMQVSSTLLNSDSRTRVKCENIFCESRWQIKSHNDTHSCHDDTHLKSIENSEATMTQSAKNFHTKLQHFLCITLYNFVKFSKKFCKIFYKNFIKQP